MTVFALPDLGEGLQDAELVAWHVAAGDHVVADQPLASVETEKAVVEIPSPRSGHVARLCAKPGDRVKVGAPLVEFEEAAHADEGAVVGHLPEAPAPRAPAPRAPAPRAPLPRAEARRTAVRAAPAVRALAARLGVDLATVPATGVEGTITQADVQAAAHSGQPATAAGERLNALRRTMAANMARAHAQVVPATVCDDADIGSWSGAETVMPRLVRAIVAGVAAQPSLNAWFDGAALTLARRPAVDIGIAVDTASGLIVPVLRDAGRRSPAQLAAELERLRSGAATRSLAPDELRGASITLSNFGAIGGRYAQLVVMPPQVAILGAGRIFPVLAPGRSGPEARRSLPLSLTFDHRAITGGEAARFLAAVIADLQSAT
ncbi:MAG: 2-oxo acid dehydrogenase subunit E2 [Alphaproteobacteria bacterium]|nr:2-oxo acid dehydrogenase subunit E2 [Alphaproteobacteria bacterium]